MKTILPKEIAIQVAKQYNIQPSEVEAAYRAWWKEVYNHMLESTATTDGIINTDINIPEIGRFVLNIKRFRTKYAPDRHRTDKGPDNSIS